MNKRFFTLVTSILMIVSLTACTFGTTPEITNVPPADPVATPQASIDPGTDNDTDTPDVETVNPDTEINPDLKDVFTKAEDFSIPTFDEVVYSDDQLIEASIAYYDYLCQLYDNLDEYEYLYYMPINLNDSNLLDLAYATDFSHAASVTVCRYDFNRKEVIEIGSYGSYGTMIYAPNCNLIETYYSGMGYSYTSYLYIDDNNNEVTLQTFEDDFYVVDDYEAYLEDPTIYGEDSGIPEIYCNIDDVSVTPAEYKEYQQYWVDKYDAYLTSLYVGEMIPFYAQYEYKDYQALYFEDEDVNNAIREYRSIIENSGDIAYEFVNISNIGLPALAICDGEDFNDAVELYMYDPYDDTINHLGTFGYNGTMQYIDGGDLFVSAYVNGDEISFTYYTTGYNWGCAQQIIRLSYAYTEDDNHEIEDIKYCINGCRVSDDFYENVSWSFSLNYNYVTYTLMSDDTNPSAITSNFMDIYTTR